METTKVIAHIHVQLLIFSYSNTQNSLYEKCAEKKIMQKHTSWKMYIEGLSKDRWDPPNNSNIPLLHSRLSYHSIHIDNCPKNKLKICKIKDMLMEILGTLIILNFFASFSLHQHHSLLPTQFFFSSLLYATLNTNSIM